MKKTILAACVAVFMLASCSTSQSALNDLRDLSTQINVEGPTYGINDWRKTAQRYYKVDRKILKHVQKDAYTPEEMQEIGELQGSCVSGFAKGVGQNVTTKVMNAANVAKGIAKGLIEGFMK